MADYGIKYPTDPDEEYFELLELYNGNLTEMCTRKIKGNNDLNYFTLKEQQWDSSYSRIRNILRETFLTERYPYQFLGYADFFSLQEYCLKEPVSWMYELCLIERKCYRCQKSRMEWVNNPCGHLLWCAACKEWALGVIGDQAEPHICVVCDRQVHSVEKLSSIWVTEENAADEEIAAEEVLEKVDDAFGENQTSMSMADETIAINPGRDESTALPRRLICARHFTNETTRISSSMERRF